MSAIGIFVQPGDRPRPSHGVIKNPRSLGAVRAFADGVGLVARDVYRVLALSLSLSLSLSLFLFLEVWVIAAGAAGL
eukprot:6749292-Pyramimonas_sp.AAC.1